MIIAKKMRTLLNGIQERGLFGFFKYYFFESDREWMGYLIEITGNRARIDGLLISLDNEVIPRHNKSQILQGRFEYAERQSVKEHLDSSQPVIELGGSIGVVACTTNRLLAHPEKHVVVEASPIMAQTLKKNKALNNCQFTIINRALAYGSDTIQLNHYGFSTSIRNVSTNSVQVETISLADILHDHPFDYFSLVCDIEGAEVDLVKHEGHILQEKCLSIMVELHPTITTLDEVTFVQETLESLGFEEITCYEETFVYVNHNLTAM